MLSHISLQNTPQMVEVSDKAITKRTAIARVEVLFPEGILEKIQIGDELHGPKGPIFQTAIIAGIMAAKNTSQLIPMCHPLPVEACNIRCTIEDSVRVIIECEVKTTHKTGVEMEALTGASIAALTIYDMCKALSHGIRISDLALVSKTGGKSDYGTP